EEHHEHYNSPGLPQHIRGYEWSHHVRPGNVDAQRSASQCNKPGCNGYRQPNQSAQQISASSSLFTHGKDATPPDIAVKDFSYAKKQVVKHSHYRGRKDSAQQHGLVRAQVGINLIEVNDLKHRHADDHNADQNEQRLYIVGTDDSVETSEHRVLDTNKKDNTRAILVGYACNRIHQYAARHSHTNQPYKPIADADQKEQDPCRLSIPQPDEVATCITHGHQCTNSCGKWREKQQAQCSSRVSDHSPDAEFEGKLRRKHGGIG